MNLQGIRQAFKAYRAAKKQETASEAAVARRARVCKVCPMKREVSGYVGKSSQILGYSAARGQVPPDLLDFQCGVCKCSLLLLVPARRENLHQDSPKERVERLKKAPGCWLLETEESS